MRLIFYHVPMSTSNQTEAVLAELAVPHQRVILDIGAGDTRQPGFLALNPNGRVPVILHDGTPIWESAAITMYLGEVFGTATALYPAPGTQRGTAMAWIAWSNTTLAAAAGRLSGAVPNGSDGAVVDGSRDLSDLAHDDAAEAAARADVATVLAVVETGLADRDFMLGSYTIVDTHLFVLVGWIASMGVDLAPLPRIDAWLTRCAARPALAALMAD